MAKYLGNRGVFAAFTVRSFKIYGIEILLHNSYVYLRDVTATSKPSLAYLAFYKYAMYGVLITLTTV